MCVDNKKGADVVCICENRSIAHFGFEAMIMVMNVFKFLVFTYIFSFLNIMQLKVR